MKRASAARLLSRTGLLALLGQVAWRSGVLCLNYHRVGDGGRSVFDRDLWSADAESFDAHVAFLKASYDVVSPRDLPAILSRRRGRFVLITFDDGYLDNYEAAFPVLKRHGVPATFFVTTGFVDGNGVSWWDEIAWMVRTSRKSGLEAGPWFPRPIAYDEPDRTRAIEALLRTYKAMPADSTGAYLAFLADATGSGRYEPAPGARLWMSWDMLRDMRAAGMVIGGHTVSHPVLSRLPPEGQCAKISGCGRRLAEELGERMEYFSYPDGQRDSFDGGTRTCLAEAGVRYAFSYYGGVRGFADWDDLDVRRIAVERYMDPDWVRASVTLPGVFGRAG
jgi:peptidoglycan/xylan/chitin deacetylase (PgdA/CDA1 family)